jgi:hypothetical protein
LTAAKNKGGLFQCQPAGIAIAEYMPTQGEMIQGEILALSAAWQS